MISFQNPEVLGTKLTLFSFLVLIRNDGLFELSTLINRRFAILGKSYDFTRTYLSRSTENVLHTTQYIY